MTTRTPVCNEDGRVQEFFIRIGGIAQQCEVCKANVFHKPDDQDLTRFKCNGCGTEYTSE